MRKTIAAVVLAVSIGGGTSSALAKPAPYGRGFISRATLVSRHDPYGRGIAFNGARWSVERAIVARWLPHQ